MVHHVHGRILPALRVRLLKLASPAVDFIGPAREFHVSRVSRNLYHFNHAFFSLHGNVILPDFVATRLFAQRLNEKRQALNIPEKNIKAGSLNAMGLIDEILHHVVGLYIEQVHPQIFKTALLELDKRIGTPGLKKALLHFCVDFPAQAVFLGQMPPEEYLLGTSQGVFVREIVLEEILLLWLANVNPAFSPFRELFDDSSLEKNTAYPQVIDALQEFFSQQLPFGPEKQNLIAMLRSPALAYPHSLPGQLLFMQENWGLLLGKFAPRLLANQDVLREEEKTFLPGPGPATVFATKTQWQSGEEGEKFSVDREWMPNLVLLAKTVYVWLDQLGKKYGRPIANLEQIPDEELDALANWGFNGLWLIGIWERSPASRRIKQKCGNPEALASAYSLFQYEVAPDLGGEKALQNLKARAAARGIRLASDMVPNHMGIDSPWVCEHPEWFVSLEQSPFPDYTFSGEDISSDPRVAIYLEDHYYDRSDAAVVFKWVDRKSGVVHYIYHGNDGTRMPWNDTAQLNYLHSEVRDAVMNTILAVARKFPIIRFDAAMTLTRRHYQRLWFPQPGSGGDIPSRSGHSMGQAQFDRSMPNEFWREVVDRVAREAPDTLLLAEAFWLMESYFVRSLGMHRVYNSAFMNFLKDEENYKFRASLKNVLEFNPEILKRFVNFMNNPDEETAVVQFGKDDKYFGTCTLLATLPGLPMFGHGQIEGFAEKYGMEYRKAYRDERPDKGLISRHEQQIFPLLKKRQLFSGLSHFLLYDFFTANGVVDENVIAFSNRHKDERCLVIYHNCFGFTTGSIKVSVAFSSGSNSGDIGVYYKKNIAEGLDVPEWPHRFVVFRDMVTQLKYIRNCRQLHEQGLTIELDAYQTHVFLDFKEIEDDERGNNARLTMYLNGRGVPSLDEAMREMALQPLLQAFQDLCRPELLERMRKIFHDPERFQEENALWEELEIKIRLLAVKIGEQGSITPQTGKIAEAVIDELIHFRRLFGSKKNLAPQKGEAIAVKYLQKYFLEKPEMELVLLLWLLVRQLSENRNTGTASIDGQNRFETWQLDAALSAILRSSGWSKELCETTLSLIKIAIALDREFSEFADALPAGTASVAVQTVNFIKLLLAAKPLRDLLQVHSFRKNIFFEQQAFDNFNDWAIVLVFWELILRRKDDRQGKVYADEEFLYLLKFLPVLAEKAAYNLDVFLEKFERLGSASS